MRKVSHAVHLWLGLIAALFLLVEGVTGGIVALAPEVIRMLNSGPRQAQPSYHARSTGPMLPLSQLVPKLSQAEPGLPLRMIRFASTANDPGFADFDAADGTPVRVWFDPPTGEILGVERTTLRAAWLYRLTRWAQRFHGDFPAAVALLLMAATGLILWWPRRILAVRRPWSLRQTTYDLHATIGFYASLLLFLFAGTGVMMGEQRLVLRVAAWVTHTPPPARVVEANRPIGQRAAPLDLDGALALARADRQGGTIGGIQWVRDDGKNSLVAFQYRDAELSGRLMVDLRTGRLREFLARRTQTPPDNFVRLVRQVHEGEIYGDASRWIAGASGFLLAILAVTGPLIWYQRRRKATPGAPEM